MINIDLLDRALFRSLRQTKIRNIERFRCKEPLAEELCFQLNNTVPNFAHPKASRKLIQFAQEINDWCEKNKDHLSKSLGTSLLSPLPNIIKKKQPAIIDSIIATLVRLELLTKYLPYLPYLDAGCILGGSLSYGKFFNVRQSFGDDDQYGPSSDIDLLMVIDFDSLYNTILLAKKYANIDEGIKYILYGLKPLFEILQNESRNLDASRTILSKKFVVESTFDVSKIFLGEKNAICTFLLSIHLMNKDAFDILVKPLLFEDYIRHYHENKPLLYDIRIDSKLPNVLFYSIMEGISVPESLSKPVNIDKNVPFGNSTSKLSICKMPAYFYWEERYVSSTYQNLILPNFELLSDNKSGSLSKGLGQFKKFLKNECYRELTLFRDSRIKLSNLHPRHLIFPQYVSKTLDRYVERHLTVDHQYIRSSYQNIKQLKLRKEFHKKYRRDDPLFNRVYELFEKKDCNILELGCGAGDFFNYLATVGHRGTRLGIDLTNAWENVNYFSHIGQFIKGDVNKLSKLLSQSSYKGKFFDVVISIHVLYHIDNIPFLFEQILACLKDDSIFIATTNSNNNLFFINNILSQAMFNLGIGAIFNKKYNSFSSENALDILREYFTYVQNITTESEIEIEDAYDIIQYIESNFDNYEIPQDDNLRKKLKEEIGGLLEKNLNEGRFVDRKVVSIIVAKGPIFFDRNNIMG